MGRLSSHFVVIVDLIFILCDILYDIIRIKLLDMKIMPMKVDAHYLRPNLTLVLMRPKCHCRKLGN